jgi:hypothetical protein
MGEAVYYLKANGCTEEIFEKVKLFIREGSHAEQWWQDHRDYERGIGGTRSDFWIQFDERFPMVSKYLKFIKLHGKDCHNDLAGYLDFGWWEDGDDDSDEQNLEYDNEVNAGELRYHALVWHFAEWNGFAKFLTKEFGLKNVRWVSDEYSNPFDLM